MLLTALRDALNGVHSRGIGYVTIVFEGLRQFLGLLTSYWLRDSVGYEFHVYERCLAPASVGLSNSYQVFGSIKLTIICKHSF